MPGRNISDQIARYGGQGFSKILNTLQNNTQDISYDEMEHPTTPSPAKQTSTFYKEKPVTSNYPRHRSVVPATHSHDISTNDYRTDGVSHVEVAIASQKNSHLD